MALVAWLYSNLADTVYLQGSAVAQYTGSGSPWDTSSTTPFEIAINDVTGPRFTINAPPHIPLQSGGGIFSPWMTTLAYAGGNRTVEIPIQARASSEANMMALLNVLRRHLFDATVKSSGVSLIFTYGGRTTQMRIENGTFQENARFWAEEQGAFVMRGVMTLECRIGTASAGVQLGSSTTITNAVANTSLMSSLIGDWRHIGQPLELNLSGGDIGTSGTKIVYAAITRTTARNNSSFAESLVTSTGAVASGTHQIALPTRRATSVRLMTYLTSPSSNLEVRGVVRYDSTAGQAIYVGPWIAPGTSNIIVDLGYLKPDYIDVGMTLLGQLQYRSTNGAATSGTYVYFYFLEYFTFCKVTPPAATSSSETIMIASPSPGIDSGSPVLLNALPHPGFAIVYTSSVVITQHCAVAGQYPVAIRDAGIFLAWVDGGVTDITDTISLESYHLPLYETVADA